MTVVVLQKIGDMYTEDVSAQFITDAAGLLASDQPEAAAELVRQMDRAFEVIDDLEDLIRTLDVISDRAEHLLYPEGYLVRWDVIDGYIIESED